MKIEAVSDDGEIEFEDDEDEEDPYGHSYNLEFNEINQSYPNVPSSSSLFHNPVHQFGSSKHSRFSCIYVNLFKARTSICFCSRSTSYRLY